MEDSGERMYYVQCPTCKDNYSEDSSIEDALDSWVSTADDLAQKMCEDAEMDVESELTPGNTEIQFRYDPEPLPYGRWTFTVQFEDMGTIWEDDTEYSTLEELKSFHENFNKWCLTYFGGTNTVQENAMKWLLNLFKANKTPATAASAAPAQAPATAPQVPAGHLVVPQDWVRKPGEQEKLRRLREALDAAEKTPELANFAKYLKGIVQ